MSVRTDQVNLNVNINGNAAMARLNDLKKQAADLRFGMRDLKKGSDEYIAASKQLDTVKAEMADLKKEIGLAALNERELASEIKKLSALRGSVAPLTEEWNKYDLQLQEAKARLAEIKESSAGVTSANEGLASSVGGLVKGFLGFMAIDKVMGLFGAVKDESNQAEDALNDMERSLRNAGRPELLDGFLLAADKFADKYKALDNDDITKVFSKLVDYGKLSQNQITQLTDVIVNYARVEKVSLNDAADVMTKALEGSGKALKGYGINVKDAHTVTERYNILIGQLGEKVKGAEDAFEQTGRGMQATFGQEIRNIEESIGNFFTGTERLKEQQVQLGAIWRNEAKEGQNLVAEYEQLSAKTKQTAEDKTRLQSITSSLAATFGNSVVQINKETGALELNIEAAKQAIKTKFLLGNQKASEVAGGFVAAQDNYKAAATDATTALTLLQQSAKRYGVTVDDVRAFAFGYNDAISRQVTPNISKQNLELVKLFNTYDAAAKSAQQYASKSEELNTQLKEFGLTADELNTMLNPDLSNKAIGGGDPNDEGQAKMDEKLAAAQQFEKRMRDLQEQSTSSQLTQNEKIVADIHHKYAEVEIAYEELVKKFPDIKLKFNLDDLKKMEAGEIAGALQKQAEEQVKKGMDAVQQRYAGELEAARKHAEDLKFIEAENFNAGLIDEKQYRINIAKIDQQATDAQLDIAKTYAGNRVQINGEWVAACKQADEDVTKFTTQQVQKQTDAVIAGAAKQLDAEKAMVELNKRVAKDNADTKLALAIKGTKSEYEAEENANKAAYQKELADLDDQEKEAQARVVQGAQDEEEQRMAIFLQYQQLRQNAEERFDQKQAQARKKHFLKELDDIKQKATRVIQFAQTLSNVLNNIESARLQREINANNQKQAAYKKQLDGKLISEAQYQLKVDKLNQDTDAKKKAIELQAFKRQKALNIAQAIINGATAQIKTWAEMGWPAAIPVSIALGVATLAEIAAIATEQPSFGTGGLLDGPKHSSAHKGMPVIDPVTGKTQAMFEGGEALLTAAAMDDNTPMVLSGTPRQIASKINSLYGGVSFADGAIAQLNPAWQNITPTVNAAAVARVYGSGGYFGSTTGTNSTSIGNDNALLSAILAQLQAQHETISKWPTRLKGEFIYRDLQDTQNLLNMSQKASALNQNG